MLLKLDSLGKDLAKTFEDVEIWEEIEFSEEDKIVIKDAIEGIKKVNNSSIQISVSNKIHSIIPSQYILYAVLVKEFALRLREYTNLIDQIKNSQGKDKTWDAILNSDISLNEITLLDENSQSLIFLPFKKGHCLMDAKDILNGDTTNRVLRSTKDFFGSVILKIINVQDVSSSILGKLIYDLANNKDQYDYLEQRFVSFLPVIRSHQTISEFVKLSLTFIEKSGNINKFLDLLKPNSDVRHLSIESGPNKLTSIFYQSDKLVTEEDLTTAGKLRFIPTPIFHYKNQFLYLSKEWTNSPIVPVPRLDFGNFKELFESLYPNFKINLLNGNYELTNSNSNLVTEHTDIQIVGSNKIYYGAPGTGKSHSIDNFTKSSKVIRTIFHPDTQYADFVGCIKPAFDDGELTYAFRAGPFTNSLIQALNASEIHHYLIIEEVNRAPAASVFGEIFQLLDRDSEGKSVYGINPSEPELLNFINANISTKLADNKIKIPANLSIIATMNSSDQAVMPMDTAFKRRWSFEYVPMQFDNCPSGEFSLTYSSSGQTKMVSWKTFAMSINRLLANSEVPEDRHLGPYFLNQQDLKDSNTSQNALIGKIFIYLWDDVLRHGLRNEIFDSEIKTFGDLITGFKSGSVVFSQEFLSDLNLLDESEINVTITDDDSSLS